jgi:hypothetical protein
MTQYFKESGFAHFLMLIILLVGLGVGLYLVTHPTLFKPRAAGLSEPISGPVTPKPTPTMIKTVFNDFNRDKKTDLAVFRTTDNNWYINAIGNFNFGQAKVLPVPGDYDGDRITDRAYYNPADFKWYIQKSGDSQVFISTPWGYPTDIPVPGDYDGDNFTDIAVFRPSNDVWYILFAKSNFDPATQKGIRFGSLGDVPVPGDYEGIGKTELATLNPQTMVWYISKADGTIDKRQFGQVGYIPLPADYDGDGQTDLMVFDANQAVWYLAGSRVGVQATNFGSSGDIPILGDYDGDGITDQAVCHPENNICNWSIMESSTKTTVKIPNWGYATDLLLNQTANSLYHQLNK